MPTWSSYFPVSKLPFGVLLSPDSCRALPHQPPPYFIDFDTSKQYYPRNSQANRCPFNTTGPFALQEPSIENINAITNHPDVKALLGMDEYVEMGHVIGHPRVVTCDFGDGYVVFSDLEDTGVYEAHIAFLPQAWGIRAVNCAREALECVFARDDCLKVVARPMSGTRRVVRFCYLLGFDFTGLEQIAGDIPYKAVRFEMTKGEWQCLH